MSRSGMDLDARVLIIEGNREVAQDMQTAIEWYFEKRSLPITCDWVPSIERTLLQIRYYDYDIAVCGMDPAPDEFGLDLLELLRERKYDFPVVLAGTEQEAAAAEQAYTLGAIAFIVRRDGYLASLAETVDNGILRYRATREQARLNRDLMEKNLEMKAVNELLARQSVRLLKLRKEQEAQRQRMESLLNEMSDGVVFINSRQEIEMLNPAARRIFRLDGAAAFKLDDLAVFIGFNPFSSADGTAIGASVFSRDYEIDTRVVAADGEAPGRMLVLRDVTQEREIERLKAEFQSMVSHELRTPLTAIRGAVENFLRGALGAVADEQRPFLEMILRNVERQTALVNDMLDLAKLEANMMSPSLAAVDPSYVVRMTHESFRYACAEKDVALKMEIEPDLPAVYADERMLCQILDNLVSNAMKFTPEGGVITIRAAAGPAGGEMAVRLSVADSGIGVPDGLKEKIFDRYFQADSSAQRQYKGTGLGLAICRKMADLHNGSIVCGDAPGGGAVFTLTVPVQAAMRKKIVLVTTAVPQGCEDEKLLMREFRVIRAERPEGAAEQMLTALPQLVLMDYHMAPMDGMEVYRAMKQVPAIARVPVIFLGAELTEQEKVRAFNLGAADIISRPYNPGEFLARVKRVIG